MSRALVLGAAFVDVVVNVPRLPFSGGDVTGELKSYRVGGSAFNVYGAIRHSSQAANLFVPVGVGQYADRVRNHLTNKQIPLSLPVSGADNGWDLSLVEPDGERSFLTIDGIEQQWENTWFDRINMTDYEYIYISGYELENPKSARVILEALKHKALNAHVLFDTSPRIGQITPDILKGILTDHVIVHCNEDEIAQVMPEGDTLPAKARRIFDLTHSPVIITLGGQGTYYYDGKMEETLAAEQVSVVNTIGAGDTHCGGLIASLMAGQTLRDAILQANKLSAQVVGQESGSLY
ncbi:PfkB family carbohydrate kinase [Levilactobacillus parabrevis]|uniref:PfkB family carbohydrate kinase n=1 Tax=Levilactobacillus parabrevis TaxID=357278 RepID=UPI0021A4FDFB|nr:PfkB family carbohydrate kinase [Levilactobacillus parabrevis]MCT4488210.1 ribokinase [Levilactobacillus parabrevis]MCT4490400.1 ribokinase [Levilactobacillus parabrevis]